MEAKEKLRRRAHYISRHDLQDEHWDNCKIKYSHPHAYGLCFEMLVKGYDHSQIHSEYRAQLQKWHGLANDRRAKFEPSGLIADARKALLARKPKFDRERYQRTREAERLEQERLVQESEKFFREAFLNHPNRNSPSPE